MPSAVRTLALACVIVASGCGGASGPDADARVQPAFGSPLEELSGWTHDYSHTYDGHWGLLKHAASGSEILWGWDFLNSGQTVEERTADWRWKERIEVGGREFWFGRSDEGRLELFCMDTGQVAHFSPSPRVNAGELLGAVMTRWDELIALRTTSTFVE